AARRRRRSILCRAVAPRAAGLSPGLCRDAAVRRDVHQRPTDRRHLLLLSGRPRHFGKRAFRQTDVGAGAVNAEERKRFALFLLAGGTAALVNILSRIAFNWLM